MAVFDDILKQINFSVTKFNRRIPNIQKQVLQEVELAIRKLELTKDNKIKTTVKNILVIKNIKDKILKLVLTEDYKREVKDFKDVFNQLQNLQNNYWKSIDQRYKPSSILNEVKKVAIEDTVKKLTEVGIGANIGDPITDILRTNVTTGGSINALTDQLRESLTTTKTPGALERYTKQITTDSVNQFNAQYTHIVASDLGYVWFKYDNTDIETTRPFCDAMTDQPYFHISEIPNILKAIGLTYVNKKGERVPVPLYAKTGLPHGMIPGTNESNFFVLRGGYNCGHQIRPTNEKLVPQDVKDRVFASPAYVRWITGQRVNKEQLTDNVTDNIQLAKAQNLTSTEKLFKDANGNWVPARKTLHDKIISGYMNKGSINQGKMYILGGAPANGKSTLVDSGKLPIPKGVLKIDADEIKGKIPEYNELVANGDPAAARFVHEESSYLTKQVIKAGLERNYDLVSDGVQDGSFDDLLAKLQGYKNAGKALIGNYVSLDLEKSLQYARERAARTGREVPEPYIRDMNREIAKLVPKLLQAGIFDEFKLWDTNVSGSPRLIVEQKNGQTNVVDQQLYDNFLSKQNDH